MSFKTNQLNLDYDRWISRFFQQPCQQEIAGIESTHILRSSY